MYELEPSRTAFAAAAHRAAHQLLEQGRIFADPLALPMLGQAPGRIAAEAQADPSRRGMRLFIAARARFTETIVELGAGKRDVRQVVVLGAGLDTFAYRRPRDEGLRVFEVDHPATQAWKRRRLGEIGVAEPTNLTFVGVNFERDRLLSRLEEAGLDPQLRTVFSWLGVAPYLTESAVWATLTQIGALSGGAEVVFDYGDPPATLTPEARALHEARAERVAALGEPFLSYFEPEVLHARLRRLGLTQIEDMNLQALARRYVDPLTANGAGGGAWPERGGHVIWAATVAQAGRSSSLAAA